LPSSLGWAAGAGGSAGWSDEVPPHWVGVCWVEGGGDDEGVRFVWGMGSSCGWYHRPWHGSAL
jgi:hypothetical protein